MNLYEWKQKYKSKRKEETVFRGMSGYTYLSPFSTCEISFYYPKDLVSIVHEKFPGSEVRDVYYKIDQYVKGSDRDENIYLSVMIDSQPVVINVYLSFTEGKISFDMDYFVNTAAYSKCLPEHWKAVIKRLYLTIKAFMEENSPIRLLILSSLTEEEDLHSLELKG